MMVYKLSVAGDPPGSVIDYTAKIRIIFEIQNKIGNYFSIKRNFIYSLQNNGQPFACWVVADPLPIATHGKPFDGLVVADPLPVATYGQPFDGLVVADPLPVATYGQPFAGWVVAGPLPFGAGLLGMWPTIGPAWAPPAGAYLRPGAAPVRRGPP